MDEELIEVRWYCGGYIGPTIYRYTDFSEPEECGYIFTTKESKADWTANTCQAKCPKCGNILSQSYDQPEAVWS